MWYKQRAEQEEDIKGACTDIIIVVVSNAKDGVEEKKQARFSVCLTCLLSKKGSKERCKK